jgi:hypothetical protein
MKYSMQPFDPSTLGISAFAAAHAIDVDHLLVLQSSVLAGIAGIDPYRYSFTSSPVILPASAGNSRRVLEKLTVSARLLHRSSVGKRRYIRVRDAAKVLNVDESLMLRSYVHAAASSPQRSPEPLDHHLEDYSIPDSEIRLEAELRPGFLVDSLDPRRLEAILAVCHRCEGFYAASSITSLPAAKKDRQKWVERICRFLDGTTIPGRPGLDPGGASDLLSARLQMVLMLGREDLGWLLTECESLLSRCLLLPVETGSPAPDPADKDDDAGSDQYLDRFEAACRIAIASRRTDQIAVIEGWHSTEAEREFEKGCIAHARQVSSDPLIAECQPLVRLPEFLAFGIRLLGWKRNVDDFILETVFPAARRIAEAQSRAVAAHRQADEVDDILELAKKLLKVVGKKQPVTFRDLVRSFDRQRVSIYRPVIDVLLVHRVLTGDPASGFSIGSRALDEIELKHLVPVAPKKLP